MSAPAPTVTSSATSPAVGTVQNTIPIVKPGTIANNDLGITILDWSSTAATLTTSSNPAGWSLITAPGFTNPQTFTTTQIGYAYQKNLTTADQGQTDTWTLSTTTRPLGIFIGISGADLSAAFNGLGSLNNTSTSPQSTPSVISYIPNSLILTIECGRDATGGAPVISLPANQTAITNVATTFGAGGINVSIYAFYTTTPGGMGTYGGLSSTYTPAGSAINWTFAISPNSSGGFAAQMLA